MSSSSDAPSRRRLPPAEIDERLVAEAIARHVGRRPRALLPLATLPPRVVWEASFDAAPPLIFKGELDTGSDDAIVLECWAMDRARERGAPVPRVHALDTTLDVFPGRFAIFERAPGVAMSELPPADPRRAAVLVEAGRAMRHVHEVSIAGFGRLDDGHYLRTGEVRGTMVAWRDYAFERAFAAIGPLTAAGLLSAADAAIFEQTLVTASHEVGGFSDGRLLHGDLDETHIFLDPDRGGLTGIIDWGDRESGDPAFEFAMFALFDGMPATMRALEGYAPDAAERERVAARARSYLAAEALRLAKRRLAGGRRRNARAHIVETLQVLERYG
jgi:aminoglycoside phosphotransferase (APT) family kinase protein